MARPTKFADHRYLGDKRHQRVHDLDQAVEACGIDELMESERFAAFGPDTLPEARNRGYRACRHCIGRRSGGDGGGDEEVAVGEAVAG